MAPRPLQPLLRYYGPVRHPLAFLPFPGVAGYRPDLLQRFLAGTRRASPVCLMRPCHRAVANTPPKWFAASVRFRRAMLRSPSSEGFRLWGEYFSRLLCVHCSLRPDDLLTILKMALSINERFGFPLPLYPSYEVLTLTSVGLPPTEHIALLSFLDVPELNTLPARASVYASPAASRPAVQDSRSRWSRCSFPVGLFHPLQCAGLSRRSAVSFPPI